MERRFTITIDRNISGGAEHQAVTLANYFVNKGYQVTVINSDEDSDFYQIDDRVKIVKMKLDYSKSGTVQSVARCIKKWVFLMRYFSRHKSDTVLTFLPNMEIPTMIAAKIHKIKIYTSVLADPRTYAVPVRIFRMIMFPRITGVIFQTEKVKNFKDYKRVKRSTVIRNPLMQGIDKRQVSLMAVQREPKIFTAGRLETVKNQAGLIRAFSRLSSDYPEVKLYIFGEGTLREDLRELIDELDMQKVIFLPGAERDVIFKNRNALIFILNSHTEGMPNALMEAMAYGIPVISTDFYTGAARELIHEGENGFLVPVNNEERLEKKIRYILNHPDIAEKVGREATEIYETCNIERIGMEWESFMFGESGD